MATIELNEEDAKMVFCALKTCADLFDMGHNSIAKDSPTFAFALVKPADMRRLANRVTVCLADAEKAAKLDGKSKDAESALTNDELNAAVMPGIEERMYDSLWHRARLRARHGMERALSDAKIAGVTGLPAQPTVEQVDEAARRMLKAWGDQRTRDAVEHLDAHIKSTY